MSSKGSYEPAHMHGSSELSLLDYTKYGSRGRLRLKVRRLVPLDTSSLALGPRRAKTRLRGFANNWKVSYLNLLQAKFQFSC